MAGNTFGKCFSITTYGESHGEGVGVIIDGCPAGIAFDYSLLENDLLRRRPGQSAIVSQRREADQAKVLSGVYNGLTAGTPIAIHIANSDARSKDYTHLENAYRPSHGDFTYDQKYGFRDPNGGGRASARETAARVAAGAVAKMLLAPYNINIIAYVSQVGSIALSPIHEPLDFSLIETNAVRCPQTEVAAMMENYIRTLKKQGDSTGGIVSALIQNCPAGLGEPVFDKLHADLGKAMLSINAVKGFEYGSGFAGVAMRGSEHNDIFYKDEISQQIRTKTNFSGGIQAGISNGMDIHFRVAFKPVATILQKQKSVNKQGETIDLEAKGRHDPCVVPRAVPIVEAMAAIVVADHILRDKLAKV
ncbi:MAG: chorismate synthase [Chitinophagales bacterium]|nr:chorismate synthase [Bacteroidota bacterium]